MRTALIVLGVLLALGIVGAGFVYSRVISLTSQQVTPDLHVIFGMGSNVAVLRTGEGAIVVDTMTFTPQGAAIRKKATELAGEEVIMVINSHYHLDHTHGNPAFPEGTRVVSTERTLWHLEQTDMDHFEGAEALLPNETFDSHTHLTIGNKNLTLLHPGRGHTDGDLVVLFEEDRVVHMGDLHFNGHYPNIDLEAGGSVQRWPASIERVILELDFDIVIPGHGEVTDVEGLRQFQRFVAQLGEVGNRAAESGLTLEQVTASTELTEDAGYTPIKWLGISIGLDREFVLRRAWEEETGNFVLRE